MCLLVFALTAGCLDETTGPGEVEVDDDVDDGDTNDVSSSDDGDDVDDDRMAADDHEVGDDETGDDEPSVERADGDGYTVFTGSGDASTETVEVDGLTKLSVENVDREEDTGVFYLDIVDFEGDTVEDVVRSEGNWSGEALRHLPGGAIGFDVQSRGDWTVNVSTRVDADDAGRPEVDEGGSYGAVYGPFEYEETVELTLEVRDDEHAVVDLYSTEGRFDSMLNLVGAAEDTMVYSTGEVHWIYVDTDSRDWRFEARTLE